MAALLRELRDRCVLDAKLIHTGQHFSPEMSDQFFNELEMPRPDYHLGIHSGSPARRMAEMMSRLEPVFGDLGARLVLVVGDVDSTVAASLVGSKMRIPVAHVEAGLRSGDRGMPEELNRLVTDALSDYLFAGEKSGVENLRAEGVSDDRIFFTGNVMIDTLLRFRERARRSDVLGRLGLEAQRYALVTLHRPSNVDQPEKLAELLETLTQVSERIPVVFPVHPRTQAKIDSFDLPSGGLHLVPAQGYLDFLALMAEARLVLTDSGGIQEETTILRTPCLTLRENTERPATIEEGSNRLVGTERQAILRGVDDALASDAVSGRRPELWDGKAAGRVVDVLERVLAD